MLQDICIHPSLNVTRASNRPSKLKASARGRGVHKQGGKGHLTPTDIALLPHCCHYSSTRSLSHSYNVLVHYFPACTVPLPPSALPSTHLTIHHRHLCTNLDSICFSLLLLLLSSHSPFIYPPTLLHCTIPPPYCTVLSSHPTALYYALYYSRSSYRYTDIRCTMFTTLLHPLLHY